MELSVEVGNVGAVAGNLCGYLYTQAGNNRTNGTKPCEYNSDYYVRCFYDNDPTSWPLVQFYDSSRTRLDLKAKAETPSDADYCSI